MNTRKDIGDVAKAPAMLVLDASYTLETIRKQAMENSVICRDLDGFFRHVWSVHPFASLLTSDEWGPRFGKPDWHVLNERHTFVEGKIGRFTALRFLPPLNFMLSQLLLFVSLLRLIRRERIALVRSGDPLYLGLFGWALARLAGVPFMIRVNANNERIRKDTGQPIYPQLLRSCALEKRIERFIFPRTDLVAAPNQDNVDFAVAQGASRARTTIFPYGNILAKDHLLDPRERGCDMPLFRSLGIEPGRYLLCVSRLHPLKFPDDAVHVAAKVRSRGHDVKLVLAGDGAMRSELQQLALQQGIGDETVFAGNLDQQTLAQLFAHTAAVISPLTGRALSEAAFGAAPIVAYDLDWQGDLIETGISGELVPFRDIGGLVDATVRFLEDTAYARTMGRGARHRAFEMLDPARLNLHERNELEKLFDRHGRREGI